MAKPLAERLKAALGPTARASDVTQLIDVVRGELDTARADLARFHAIAIDCGSDEKAADEAADAEHRTTRRITRLEGQTGQLEARLVEIVESDKRREWEEWQAKVIADRDALAQELSIEWRIIEAKIVDLLWRLSFSDKDCAKINTPSAEAVARGCNGSFNLRGMPLHRLKELQIPSFDVAEAWPAWPPRTNMHDWTLMDPPSAAKKLAECAEGVRAAEAARAAALSA